MVKELIVYSIAASIIAMISQLTEASLPVILLSSLLIPPLLLLVIRNYLLDRFVSVMHLSRFQDRLK